MNVISLENIQRFLVFLLGAFILSYSHQQENARYRDLFSGLSNTCTIEFGSLKMFHRNMISSHNNDEQSIILAMLEMLTHSFFRYARQWDSFLFQSDIDFLLKDILVYFIILNFRTNFCHRFLNNYWLQMLDILIYSL